MRSTPSKLSGLLPILVAVTSCASSSAASSGALSAVDEAPATPDGLNAPYGTERAIETWEGRFEREGREVRDRRDDILAKLDLAPGLRIADVGAGTGLYTLAFARAVGPSGTVFAVDVQDYFLEHIEAKADAAGLTNVRPVVATQRFVGLSESSVDLAFFCDAYHHVEYPHAYLASVFAAVRPGGRVVVIDYRRPEAGTGAGADGQWLRDHIRASPEQFREEFEAAGFTFVTGHDLLEENFFFVFEKRP